MIWRPVSSTEQQSGPGSTAQPVSLAGWRGGLAGCDSARTLNVNIGAT